MSKHYFHKIVGDDILILIGKIVIDFNGFDILLSSILVTAKGGDGSEIDSVHGMPTGNKCKELVRIADGQDNSELLALAQRADVLVEERNKIIHGLDAYIDENKTNLVAFRQKGKQVYSYETKSEAGLEDILSKLHVLIYDAMQYIRKYHGEMFEEA